MLVSNHQEFVFFLDEPKLWSVTLFMMEAGQGFSRGLNDDVFPYLHWSVSVILTSPVVFSQTQTTVCAVSSGRFNVSMANIYVKQQNYREAIKLYQKALDQIPNTYKEMKMKIMENFGLFFVRIGQYPKAIIYFEDVMSQSPNTKTGYNLVLCYYAIGDKERMKKGFQKLISVPLGFDEDKYIPSNVSGHCRSFEIQLKVS